MHPTPKERVPATDGSANPTSQGSLEHSSSGQASAELPPRAGLATRFREEVVVWFILAVVLAFLLLLKLDEWAHEAWEWATTEPEDKDDQPSPGNVV